MIYTDENIGAVQFTDRKNQSINFNGIKLNKIVPCDIDLICECRKKFTTEYKNKAWIFTEFKYRDAPFPFGQKLMYERLVDDLNKIHKPAISILAEHYVDNPNVDIDAAKCVVREYYYKGKWYSRKCEPPLLLGDAINKFIEKLN